MGSGKTTIGKLLAEKLYVNFEDLDEMITVEYGLSINEIFSKYGETTFRSAESNALKSSTGNVISCGGGIILDKIFGFIYQSSGCKSASEALAISATIII